ncbi:uncharacterized protein Z520_09474 [Fonsecaea multimorphosa CBS 102226]|uniref:Uncharacterized protein n=1 Tax=Fonsecaea multimorphosa CBS 102226 TaxID=1442371 RepID=A0A0D2JW90_9EURO|nr:uncharacterized protein Z520_09474 [Fonsecaea multimorphosa CBS 102226]KIX94784.1 hypothetical protein Z520_09474 [Fonsecaea multimorphosa CBS 102226]OAL20365.1 hypothetical protein AYO22_08859 [Fonsecaea multimorphosa]
MSTYKPSPLEFTSIGTIPVRVPGNSSSSRVYHVHISLLYGQSKLVKRIIWEGVGTGGIQIPDYVAGLGFEHFVTWLHNGDILEGHFKRHIINLWELAFELESNSFKAYLKEKGKECLGESDYLAFAQRLETMQPADSSFSLQDLHDYMFQGLADKIHTDGWTSFIEKTEGGWEDLMNRKDDEDGTKGKFLSSLMAWLDKDDRKSTPG